MSVCDKGKPEYIKAIKVRSDKIVILKDGKLTICEGLKYCKNELVVWMGQMTYYYMKDAKYKDDTCYFKAGWVC
ncbi:MAG TPA: hypothetical protein PKK61_05105 [Defluviitaleaceae bacterium]|nr:hypothetical protein [Defluviitaleaceae bacterium]